MQSFQKGFYRCLVMSKTYHTVMMFNLTFPNMPSLGCWRRIYKEQHVSAKLSEPDLTPTEFHSPLPAAFGRIEPTAIAFIFACHYLRPSAALTLQRWPSYSLATTRIDPTAIAFILARHNNLLTYNLPGADPGFS